MVTVVALWHNWKNAIDFVRKIGYYFLHERQKEVASIHRFTDSSGNT
jgi:hypothetical protein